MMNLQSFEMSEVAQIQGLNQTDVVLRQVSERYKEESEAILIFIISVEAMINVCQF